jgi:amphi-Trp domain-containing protein
MGKKKVELNSELPIEKATEYLENIISGLKKRKVFVQEGDEVVELTPGETVEIEVEAEQKKHSEKVTFKLCWSREKDEETENTKEKEDEMFSISSVKPEISKEK